MLFRHLKIFLALSFTAALSELLLGFYALFSIYFKTLFIHDLFLQHFIHFLFLSLYFCFLFCEALWNGC